jgi:citrate synthase
MNTGLDGVVVAQTILSEVDGERGRLIIRGFPVEELAGEVPFEAAAAKLWDGLSTLKETEQGVKSALGKARSLAFERLSPLFSAARDLTFIDGLRLGLSGLSDKEEMPHHYLATGAIPVFLAALVRDRKGLEPVAPDPSLSQSADFLRMARGERASVDEEFALDAYLVTIMEHGMNASTFTARVIASTRAGTFSSIVGALCALKGPLHGGAPGPVLDMLDEIGQPERIESWLKEQLSSGERLMGFGHRIYKVRDPRADVLKGVVARLRKTGNDRLTFAERVEQAALKALAAHKPDRPLHTNVEFYTALVLDAIGLEREMFTPAFAMGRVVGWTAHVYEQEKTGRLMRPQSEYIGPRNIGAASS